MGEGHCGGSGNAGIGFFTTVATGTGRESGW